MSEDKKIASLCYLRITVTVGVILLHVCSTLLDNPELFTLTGSETVFHSALAKSLTWCVPCFLMISGTLLLRRDKHIEIRDCVFRYARRMLLALIVFGLPFALMMDIYTLKRISPALIPSAILKVVTNNSFSHLWYLYMLTGIYLLLPAIKTFVDHCSRTVLEYTLLVMFVFNCVFPFISQITGIGIAFNLPATSCYLFYFLMGHYLTVYRPGWANSMPLAIGGVILCVSLIVVACAAQYASLNAVAAYNSFVTALLAICIFNLFQWIKREVSKTCWALDRLTFGVYLIHPVLIHLLYRVLKLTPTGALYPVKTLAVTGLVAAAAYALSWALMKIPPLKKYVL